MIVPVPVQMIQVTSNNGRCSLTLAVVGGQTRQLARNRIRFKALVAKISIHFMQHHTLSVWRGHNITMLMGPFTDH